MIAFYLGGLLALAAFAWGLGRAARPPRGRAARPRWSPARSAIWSRVAAGTPYTSAKALAIVAPGRDAGHPARPALGRPARRGGGRQAGAAGGRRGPLRPRWSGSGSRRSRSPSSSRPRFSTLLPLRQAAVGPDRQRRGADRLPRRSSTARTCSSSAATTSSPGSCSAPRSTRRSSTTTTPRRSRPSTARPRSTPSSTGTTCRAEGLDGPTGLEDFDWVLTTSAELNSEAPPEFEAAPRDRGLRPLAAQQGPRPGRGRAGSAAP